MKSIMPWFCLLAMANTSSVFANEGMDAYREGHYSEAADLLASALNKDPVVDYYMGRMRIYGYGQLKNNSIAIRYFKQAAQKGYLPALQVMGRYSLLVENNPEEALNYFKKAADENDTSAQMYCASAYLFGVGAKKNPDVAKRYFIAAAKNGNAIAQYTLAASFLETHQSANKKLGLIWLNKALAQNNPEAQLMMAEQYISGTLVPKDLVKAKELIMAASAAGYQPALYQMGQLALASQNINEARDWFLKAADAKSIPAELALANLYADQKTPLYDPKASFTWLLKAAEAGSETAALALADKYAKGEGVAVDENLAKQWRFKAQVYAKNAAKNNIAQAVSWLTNGKYTQFSETDYRLTGILGAWQNPSVLKENNYNQPPKIEAITRETLFKPQFVLVDPNQISIGDYYDALVSSLNTNAQEKIVFPHYAVKERLLSPQDAKTTNNSLVTHGEGFDYLAHLDSGKENYNEVFKKLESRAILGDSTAQFDIGQMYQYGLGVAKNPTEAIKYYRLAAAQQDLPAEYNLGLMYIQGEGVVADYKLGLNLLTDAAFKGNPYAQYVLARIYEQGYTDSSGQEVIPKDKDNAMSMYNLAAANNYGLAQFRLAELMAQEKQTDLTAAGKFKRNQMIKGLYEGAVKDGVVAANLPLAFYNAMDASTEKQTLAFNAAKAASDSGNAEADLLLGLMYDRGISVAKNHDEAISHYQKAKANPVSEFVLGTYLSNGDGISKDLEKGRAMLQHSASTGFSYANLNLAILKQQNKEEFLPLLNEAYAANNTTAGLLLADYYLSLAKDATEMKQARDIYQRLAEKGNRDGQLKLAFLYENGLGGAVDLQNAEHWYELAARQKEPVAQYLLARMYQLGKVGNAPNYAEAKKWYSIAQSSYAPAAVALGFIYDTVDDDYKPALSSYSLAASKGSAIGQFDLGLMYEKGKGMPVDFVKARELYQEAANKGQVQAMVQLAGLYLNGQGGAKDDKAALEWYQKAANLGDRDALYQLGLLAETVNASKPDYTLALEYYQKSANKGNIKASLALARMYKYGLGVPKDEALASKLYLKFSAEAGVKQDDTLAKK